MHEGAILYDPSPLHMWLPWRSIRFATGYPTIPLKTALGVLSVRRVHTHHPSPTAKENEIACVALRSSTSRAESRGRKEGQNKKKGKYNKQIMEKVTKKIPHDVSQEISGWC